MYIYIHIHLCTNRQEHVAPSHSLLWPVVRNGGGEGLAAQEVKLPGTCPSALVWNRGTLQTLGAELHLRQHGLFGGKVILENIKASPCPTLPVSFPPQPSSKKSLSVRKFPEEPECESLVRAEAGSKDC